MIYILFLSIAPPKAELDSSLVGEHVTIRAGSDLVLDGVIGGKPEPIVWWAKGDKVLELGEKYSLTYTSSRAMAIIKSCNRNDTGRYVLTAKNASGTKTVAVNVKVLGKNMETNWSSTKCLLTLTITIITHLYVSLCISRYTRASRGQDHNHQGDRGEVHCVLEDASGGWWRSGYSLHC